MGSLPLKKGDGSKNDRLTYRRQLVVVSNPNPERLGSFRSPRDTLSYLIGTRACGAPGSYDTIRRHRCLDTRIIILALLSSNLFFIFPQSHKLRPWPELRRAAANSRPRRHPHLAKTQLPSSKRRPRQLTTLPPPTAVRPRPTAPNYQRPPIDRDVAPPFPRNAMSPSSPQCWVPRAPAP